METLEPLYYFAYGSNLALQQMGNRCAGSKFYDFGVLRNYRVVYSLSCASFLLPKAVEETLILPARHALGVIDNGLKRGISRSKEGFKFPGK